MSRKLALSVIFLRSRRSRLAHCDRIPSVVAAGYSRKWTCTCTNWFVSPCSLSRRCAAAQQVGSYQRVQRSNPHPGSIVENHPFLSESCSDVSGHIIWRTYKESGNWHRNSDPTLSHRSAAGKNFAPMRAGFSIK